MRMEFSAGGVIYKETTVGILIGLILTADDQWSFPKGHIERDEKPEEAAKREAEEETGLSNLVVGELIDKPDYWFKIDGELIHKFVYIYLIESPDGDFSPQLEEVKDARWFDPQKAYEIIGYKKQNQLILQKAYTKLGIKF